MRAALFASLGALLALPPDAGAEPPAGRAACARELTELGVRFREVARKGVARAVQIRGPLGGVEYRSYGGRPLVIDCSLAYSLALAGPLFREQGVERVRFSSAYDRRRIRGTDRLSRHSFGLAIDVHAFAGPEIGALTVRDDYEQGLGDDRDCLGEPLTEGGAVLRALDCGLTDSGLFRIVLSPDYDADHYNHFHLEALPWEERDPPAAR